MATVDYRASLEDASGSGFVTLSLLYNSGLHISENGKSLAHLLEQLVQVWPSPISELHIVGHSMGGLVTRSACHYGSELGYAWFTSHLRSLGFLGTPHGGSPAERIGNYFHTITESTRFSAPFSRLGKVRSAGITDLRHGSVHAADWLSGDGDRFKDGGCEGMTFLQLPEGVKALAVGATLDSEAGGIVDTIAMGDGIVPLRSALGKHEQAEKTLAFSETVTVCGVSHVGLMGDERVGEIVKAWCGGEQAMGEWRAKWSFGGTENRDHHLGPAS